MTIAYFLLIEQLAFSFSGSQNADEEPGFFMNMPFLPHEKVNIFVSIIPLGATIRY
jgi:hypothetical protein